MEDIENILNTIPTNPHYVNRYINFINSCIQKNNLSEILYTEKHHILPKSLFPKYKSFKTTPWNKATLTSRQHFIAHFILTKIFLNDKIKLKMLFAFNFFKSKKGSFSSKLYAVQKLEQSNLMKIYNPMFDPEIKKKSIIGMKRKWTPEYRKKVSDKMKSRGLHLTENAKKNLSDFWKGVKKPPRTKEHTLNNRKSQSTGLFCTPFGKFYSPQSASESDLNINKLSRYVINKYCKGNINGFSFIPKDENLIENRGTYKRSEKHKENISKSRSTGLYITPFGKFYNINSAFKSEDNIKHISKLKIKYNCENNINGFSFIPKVF